MIAPRPGPVFGRSGVEQRRQERLTKRREEQGNNSAVTLERSRAIRRVNQRRTEARKLCPRQHAWRKAKELRDGSPVCPSCGFSRDELELWL